MARDSDIRTNARRVVSVDLTLGQIEALMSLCGFAAEGSPKDVSMARVQYLRLDSAAKRLALAWNKAEPI